MFVISYVFFIINFFLDVAKAVQEDHCKYEEIRKREKEEEKKRKDEEKQKLAEIQKQAAFLE